MGVAPAAPGSLPLWLEDAALLMACDVRGGTSIHYSVHPVF
jgi:hypothetical protein